MTEIEKNETSHSNEPARILTSSLTVIFMFSVMLLGGFIRILSKKFHIPFTPTIFFLGMIITFFSQNFPILKESVNQISSIDPHGLLQIFLPILIFDSAFAIDWHIFRKQIKQILVLAYPAVLVNALLMMVSVKVILMYGDEKYTWISALMFGSIVSCTDPVAVTAILKELGISKKFTTILEGESLLNDATGLIFYLLSSTIFKAHEDSSILSLVIDFFTLSLGGVAVGLIVGVFSSLFIQKLYNDTILVVNTTLISSYIAYFIAEGFSMYLGIQVSGIFAIIAYGLFMSAVGKTKINPHSDHAVHTFWSYLVYASETAIFFLAGLIVGSSVINKTEYIASLDYFKLIILYLCLNVVRFITLLIHYPYLKLHGYGLTLPELYCLAYGGLRGAVGIAFAMIVTHDHELSQELRDIFFFDMAGCAVLTLIINGTTAGIFIKKSGMIQKNIVKQQVFKGFLESLLQELEHKTEELKNNRYFQVADWEKVNEISGIYDIHHLIYDLDKDVRKRSSFEEKAENSNLEAIQEKLKPAHYDQYIEMPSVADFEDKLLIETRDRFITLLKGFYYELFKTSQCSGDAFIVLNESCNWDLDSDDKKMSSWIFISNSFYKSSYVKAVMELQNVSCIGSLIKRIIFTHVTHAYDVVSAFVEAHRKAIHFAKKFPVAEKYISQIINEAESNQNKAEEYIYSYLEVTFPEITRSVQTKRAAYTMIEYERSRLEEDYNMGQIDERENNLLEEKINEHMINLASFNPEWVRISLKKLIQNIPFFTYIPQQTIDKLCDEAIEKVADPSTSLKREGEKAIYVYIITRGGGTEYSNIQGSVYKEKLGVGSVLSFHQIVTSKPNNFTSFTPDSILNYAAIPLDSIKQIISKNIDLETFAWRESLYVFSRIFYNNLKPLGNLDKSEFLKLWSYAAFKKFKAGEIINMEKGGILLAGKLCIYNKEKHELLLNKFIENSNEIKLNKTDLSKPERIMKYDKNNQEFREEIDKIGSKKIEDLNFFEANNIVFEYLVIEDVTMFQFTSTEEIKEVFEKENLENYVKYSVMKY